MIKKNIKPWYSTKEKEQQAEWVRKLTEGVNRVSNQLYNSGTANWVIVGSDVANHLNTLYPSLTTDEAVNYTNRWCGTTYTTTHTYVPIHLSTASTMTILSGTTYNW